MGVNSSKGFSFRLMASGSAGFVQLDTFSDEPITISDNVTGLFDIGVLPSDFTRQISIPGTKVNNAFFEHVYDISIQNPYLFSTNVKVPAYFDFDGIYLSQGYLQLNKVNVKSNKYIQSYEVSIYGGLSSFARDLNKYYLTDLTTLSVYNHTSSYQNIIDSWDRNLFGGDIVYPFIDYGSGWSYTANDEFFGIDDESGGITVQDYKPAIRVKKVLDKIFEFAGYTYSSSFMNEPWLDNVYMVCNNSLKYPEYAGVDLETYGVAKWGAISGSGQTDVTMSVGIDTYLPWFNRLEDPQNFIGDGSRYRVDQDTNLQGEIQLNLNVSSSNGNVPNLALSAVSVTTGLTYTTSPLNVINDFYRQVGVNTISAGGGVSRTDTTFQPFVTTPLPAGEYFFKVSYTNQFTPSGGLRVVIDPAGTTKSYIKINKVKEAADFRVMNIQANMPFGESGIKLVDFIQGLQKKFNLVIYPDKTKSRQFIIEDFDSWYRTGETKDFNKYINLDDTIEVIPANNLAVNKLQFGDKLGNDYIALQFQKSNTREYGKSYYTDTQNFFSQGEFKVETSFSVTPLTKIPGTGLSGSVGGFTPPTPTCGVYRVGPVFTAGYAYWTDCDNNPQTSYIEYGGTLDIICAVIGSVSANGQITYITSCN
jgi:hypothetical protein